MHRHNLQSLYDLTYLMIFIEVPLYAGLDLIPYSLPYQSNMEKVE